MSWMTFYYGVVDYESRVHITEGDAPHPLCFKTLTILPDDRVAIDHLEERARPPRSFMGRPLCKHCYRAWVNY